MAKKDIKVCGYKYCKHKSKEIDISVEPYAEEQLVKSTKYYHPDCKHEKDVIAEMLDFWQKNIDNDPIFAQLRRVINNLIYDKKCDPDFLLWGLKRKAKHLNYPNGLVYVAKDKQLYKEYEFEQKLKKFNEEKVNAKPPKENETTFTSHDNNSNKKFGDIFGGH